MQKNLTGVTAAASDAGKQDRWELQLFADSASGGEGATGNSENTPHPSAAGSGEDTPHPSASLTPSPQGEGLTDTAWDGILKNPEYNRRIQDIVQKRVSGMKASLEALTPVIETLGRKYGMDVSDISKTDLGELARRVAGDAETAPGEAQEQERRRYFDDLVRQAEILKEKIPNFDLQRELQDPRFARMTAPGGGWTVEQAFNAVHHDALLRIAAEQAARQAARALANSVQAGKNLPAENGSVQRSATGTETKLYSQMSPEERAVYKQQIKSGKLRFGK